VAEDASQRIAGICHCGYTIGSPFDALVFGYYDGKDLVYAARTHNGFYAGFTRSVVPEIQRTRDCGMPVRESARDEERSVWPGPDEGEDESLMLAWPSCYALTSCGYAIPQMTLAAERNQLIRWGESKGEEGLIEYRRTRNSISLDGLPAPAMDALAPDGTV